MRFEEMPKIFGADTRKVEVCTADELKDAGVIFTSYGIMPGETVEFPANRTDIVVVKQPGQRVRQDGTRNMQYFASITKINTSGVRKPDWISMGSLVRRDANQEPVDAVSKEMLQYQDIEGRLQHLVGKKITCTGRETRTQRQFVNGVSTGKNEERPTNIYAFA